MSSLVLGIPTNLVKSKTFQLCCIKTVDLSGLAKDRKGWRLQWWHVTDFGVHFESTAVVWCPSNNDISFGVVGHTERKGFCLLSWHAASKIMLPGADTNMSRKQGQVTAYTITEIFNHGIGFKVFLGRLVLRNLQDGNISEWAGKVCLWETPGTNYLHEQEGMQDILQ